MAPKLPATPQFCGDSARCRVLAHWPCSQTMTSHPQRPPTTAINDLTIEHTTRRRHAAPLAAPSSSRQRTGRRLRSGQSFPGLPGCSRSGGDRGHVTAESSRWSASFLPKTRQRRSRQHRTSAHCGELFPWPRSTSRTRRLATRTSSFGTASSPSRVPQPSVPDQPQGLFNASDQVRNGASQSPQCWSTARRSSAP